MRRVRALVLLVAIAGAPACAAHEEPTPPPAPSTKKAPHLRKPETRAKKAAPPRESCKWKATQICNLPKDEERILASCDPPQHDLDEHGCATLFAFRVCNPSIVGGPEFEGGKCCYAYCQPPNDIK